MAGPLEVVDRKQDRQDAGQGEDDVESDREVISHQHRIAIGQSKCAPAAVPEQGRGDETAGKPDKGQYRGKLPGSILVQKQVKDHEQHAGAGHEQ